MCKPKNEGGLGFKELEAFNLAMLGKQVWRMLTKPETLVAKVFKARYFKKTTILNVNLGSRPSYAWRSLHAALRLIKKGARVVIGNGDNTLGRILGLLKIPLGPSCPQDESLHSRDLSWLILLEPATLCFKIEESGMKIV